MEAHLHSYHRPKRLLSICLGSYHVLKDKAEREEHVKLVHGELLRICVVPGCLERLGGDEVTFQYRRESHEENQESSRKPPSQYLRQRSTMAHVRQYDRYVAQNSIMIASKQ